MPDHDERRQPGRLRAEDEPAERDGDHSGGGGSIALLGGKAALRTDGEAKARHSARGVREPQLRLFRIEEEPEAVRFEPAGEIVERNRPVYRGDVAPTALPCRLFGDPPQPLDARTGPAIVELAPAIAARVARGGRLVLSGLLADQGDEAEAAYRAQGLRTVGRKQREEWIRVELERPA